MGRFQSGSVTQGSLALAEIADLVARAVSAPMVLISELDSGPRILKPHAFRIGRNPDAFPSFEVSTAPGGDLAEAGWFACSNEFASRFPAFPRGRELDVRSYAAVPVRSRAGEIVGQLAVFDRRPRRFSSTQRALLDAFALPVREEIRRLRASNAALETRGSRAEFLDAASEPMIVLAEDGRWLATNERARRLYRLGDVDSSDVPITSQSGDQPDLAHVYRALQSLAESGPLSPRVVQLSIPVQHARRIYVELARAPLVQGDLPATLVVARGISLDSPAASEASVVEDLAQNVPGALFSYTSHPDRSHTVHFMSRGLRDIVGPKNAEAIFAGTSSRSLIHPDDLSAFDRAGLESRRSWSVFDHEFRICHDDGVYRWVRALARPLRSDEHGVLWHGAIVDTSTQKETENRNRSILEQMPGLVFAFSQRSDGTGSARVLGAGGRDGCQPSADTRRSEYERFWHSIHPEDRDVLRTEARAAAATGQPLVVRCRFLSATRAVRWVQLVARVSERDEGLLDWVGMLLDVSQRVESDDRYRALVENLPATAHTYSIDADGNARMIHLGASIDEIVGTETGAAIRRDPRELRHIVHEQDLPKFEHAWTESARGLKPLDLEFRLQTDLGDFRGVRWISRPTLESGRTVWYGIFLDTGHQHAEERFWARAEDIPGVVHSYVVHADGTHEFIDCSSAFERMVGAATHERIGGSLETYMNEVIHPDDRNRVREQSRLAARNLEPFEQEYRILVDGGAQKWIRAVARPSPTASGSAIWHGMLLDVTERREAEERSRVYAADLISANQMLHLQRMVSEEARHSKENVLARVLGTLLRSAETLRSHAARLEQGNPTPEQRLAASRAMHRSAEELLRALEEAGGERFGVRYEASGE